MRIPFEEGCTFVTTKLLVVCAVEAEGQAVAAGMVDAHVGSVGPLPAWSGVGNDIELDVVVSGVGPAAAAAAAGIALALADGGYDAVLSAGVAGAFKNGPSQVGGVVIADEMVAADLGVLAPEGFLDVESLGFGNALGRSTPPQPLVALLRQRCIDAGLHTAVGPVLTPVQLHRHRRAGACPRRASFPGGRGHGGHRNRNGGSTLRRTRLGIEDHEQLGRRPQPGGLGARGRPRGAPASEHRDSQRRMGVVSTLRLGISPCPNDTFAFDALVHGRVAGAPGIEVDFADIDVLNGMASEGAADLVKVSYGALPWLLEDYALLPSGGALGRGCGPLLLTMPGKQLDLANATVAVPGLRTTAYLLFRLWAGEVGRIVVLPFDQIMPAVQAGDVDAGLVIHESRFTFPSYGLVQHVDLGEEWERTTGLAIPLGAILARRTLPDLPAIAGWVRASVEAGVGRSWRLRRLCRRARPGDGSERAGAAHRALRERIQPRSRRGG